MIEYRSLDRMYSRMYSILWTFTHELRRRRVAHGVFALCVLSCYPSSSRESNAVFIEYRALVMESRALSIECRALLMACRAPSILCRALLTCTHALRRHHTAHGVFAFCVYKSLWVESNAVFVEYRALLMNYRAVLIECRALLTRPHTLHILQALWHTACLPFTSW